MIINLRGCHGSGKTTAVRTLMEGRAVETIEGSKRRPEAYLLPEWNLAILGDYSGTKTATGADSLKDIRGLEALVRRYARRHHVFLEGAHISGMYGRWLRLSQEAGTGQFLWLFLDTPYEVCLARVQQRPGSKPVKLYIFDDWFERCQKYARLLPSEGQMVEMLNWENPDLAEVFDRHLRASPALEHLSEEPFVGSFNELPKFGRTASQSFSVADSGLVLQHSSMEEL